MTVAFIVAATLVRVAFWLYTGRLWEDALITVAHARNVPRGLGLVHHAGEGRVHGFTSALSVLVPLLGELIHASSGVVVLRLASLGAAAVAIGCAGEVLRELQVGSASKVFTFSYLAFERNQLFYGMAGMETGIAVAALLWSLLELRRDRPYRAGASMGFALLARPDFVIWVALALLSFLRTRQRFLLAISGLAAIAGPWILFTTLYYGSPVPHTIIAKASLFAHPLPRGGPGSVVDWCMARVRDHLGDWCYLAPLLSDTSIALKPTLGATRPLLALAAGTFATFGIAGMVRTRRDGALLVASLYIVSFVVYRIAFLPPIYFEWYVPPALALLALHTAVGLDLVAKRWPRAGAAVAMALSLLFAAHLPWSFVIERRVQELEERVRTPLGVWLSDHVPRGEPVVSESAGYVGFYGDVLLWDFPGLTSPTVERTLASVPQDGRTLPTTVRLLEPAWIVLRPYEAHTIATYYGRWFDRYAVAKTFGGPLETDGIEWLGIHRVEVDNEFVVYKHL